MGAWVGARSGKEKSKESAHDIIFIQTVHCKVTNG